MFYGKAQQRYTSQNENSEYIYPLIDPNVLKGKPVFCLTHGNCSIVQLVTCLATDAALTADPGVASLVPVGPIISWRLIMK